jgi:hypothetical protein
MANRVSVCASVFRTCGCVCLPVCDAFRVVFVLSVRWVCVCVCAGLVGVWYGL